MMLLWVCISCWISVVVEFAFVSELVFVGDFATLVLFAR